MRPRHPFTRESEHNVAVLEFGCHLDQGTISHPKEGYPRIRRWKTVKVKRKTRKSGDFVAYRDTRDLEVKFPHESLLSFGLFRERAPARMILTSDPRDRSIASVLTALAELFYFKTLKPLKAMFTKKTTRIQ
jgi:hypothetical protein